MKYSFSGRIRYSEIDEYGRLTLYSLINYFQDCSNFHAEDVNVGLKWMEEHRLAWILAAWQIHIDAYPAMGAPVETSTWAYGFRSCMGYRNYSMETPGGGMVARANSEWVLMDMDKGGPARVPEELADAYGLEPGLKLKDDFGSRKIRIPEGGKELPSFQIQEYQLDTNHHVNNGQYVRMALSCLPRSFRTRRLRAEYKMQAHLGDWMFPKLSECDGGYLVTLNDKNSNPYFIGELRE